MTEAGVAQPPDLKTQSMRKKLNLPTRPNNVRVVTRDELARQADRLALKAGARSREDAFRLIDRGKLTGTIVEAELKMLRSMLNEP